MNEDSPIYKLSAFCESDIICRIALFRQFVATFEMILYIELHKEIGLKASMVVASATLGMRAKNM